jgi:hypothetical protein
VTRFCDPADPDAAGVPKAVVDVMLPWSLFQELFLKEYVTIDPGTQHRLPTLEAAIVSKYAAMSSRESDRITKDYNAADFRRLVRANHDRIRPDDLHCLAALVWENGTQEIDRFVEIALTDEAFGI